MSFREKLSEMWSNIQGGLFPMLESELGTLSDKHKELVQILELVRIEEFIRCRKFFRGRPQKLRAAIARAFIAKLIFKVPYTKQFIKDYLANDMKLKEICGWNRFGTIPSESTFSRAFEEFAKSKLPEKVHQALIRNLYADHCVGHVTKDSTPIEAREKAIKKEPAKIRAAIQAKARKMRKKTGELNRRQKQLAENDLDKMTATLPIHCDKGMKKSAQGYTEIWKGYKLHAAIDDHCIPLAGIVTSASLNDCEAAIPLAVKSDQAAKSFYDLMDAAYDHPEIIAHSHSLGHIPLIDKRPGTHVQKIEKQAEAHRRQLLNFTMPEEIRYKLRFSKERFNALYKDYYGGRTTYYKGHEKITCHVMFGLLTLASSIILKLIQ
jgi:Transposase DDE domain